MKIITIDKQNVMAEKMQQEYCSNLFDENSVKKVKNKKLTLTTALNFKELSVKRLEIFCDENNLHWENKHQVISLFKQDYTNRFDVVFNFQSNLTFFRRLNYLLFFVSFTKTDAEKIYLKYEHLALQFKLIQTTVDEECEILRETIKDMNTETELEKRIDVSEEESKFRQKLLNTLPYTKLQRLFLNNKLFKSVSHFLFRLLYYTNTPILIGGILVLITDLMLVGLTVRFSIHSLSYLVLLFFWRKLYLFFFSNRQFTSKEIQETPQHSLLPNVIL